MRLAVWFFALVTLELVQASFGLLMRERNRLTGLGEVLDFRVSRRGEVQQKSFELCSAAIISRLISHGTVFFSPNKSAVQISTSGL